MKDYCAETLRKERCITVITMLFAVLICTVFPVLLIQDMAQGKFQAGLFALAVVLGLVGVGVLVKMFKTVFRPESIAFIQRIRKQQAEGGQEIPLDYIFREINDDLNRSRTVVGPFLLGEKWLLAKTATFNYEMINLSQLQGFAMGMKRQGTGSSTRRKPALVLLSGKLGLISCFSSRKVLREFYELLKSRYPELTKMGDEDANLGEWGMNHFLNAWQNRPDDHRSN